MYFRGSNSPDKQKKIVLQKLYTVMWGLPELLGENLIIMLM